MMTLLEVEAKIFDIYLEKMSEFTTKLEDYVHNLPDEIRHHPDFLILDMDIHGITEDFRYCCEKQLVEWRNRETPPMDLAQFEERCDSIISRLSHCIVGDEESYGIANIFD